MLAVIKELQSRLTAFLQDEDRCGRAITAGWMAEGHNALDPVWNCWGWNPKEKRQEKTDQQPMQSTAVQAQLQLLEDNITKERVLLNFRGTKDLEKEQDLEVVPFMITVGLRAPESHATYRAFQLLCGSAVLQAHWGQDQAGATCETASGKTAGGELPVQAVLPMEPPRFPLRPPPGLGRPEEAAWVRGSPALSQRGP